MNKKNKIIIRGGGRAVGKMEEFKLEHLHKTLADLCQNESPSPEERQQALLAFDKCSRCSWFSLSRGCGFYGEQRTSAQIASCDKFKARGVS